ncbi:hypothetical protein TNCV_1667821 [Trichonephila clavipes]|nr:hypothetical protein TNCV_1667821 [Trichonephila clavipes]
MVSPAVQGQVRHPSIVPEFLRSTSCGMTSARGHGAIVYCLNSGSEDRQTGRHNEVSEPVNKCRPLINPVVNKSVENATSCDFEKKNCDPPVRWTNVSHPSEVRGKEFNVYRNSNWEVKMKAGLCEGRVKSVAKGEQW